jgi:hypothetical protein
MVGVIRNPLVIAGVVLAMNLPFGYWRGGVRKLSAPWFVAIHLPVGLAIAYRFLIGVHFRWLTLPLYVAAFIAGQSAGGRIRGRGTVAGDDGAAGSA